jgi:electron transport complex protein RnfB
MRPRPTSTSSRPDLIEDALLRARSRKSGSPAGSPYPKVIAAPAVARIDEAACIGCALCLEACPVDAIVGAPTLMHTIIAAECIGCRLCLPPCPVDCIAMIETGEPLTREERKLRATRARRRYRNRLTRRKRDRAEQAAPGKDAAGRRKHAAVERAMERARQRLQRQGRA